MSQCSIVVYKMTSELRKSVLNREVPVYVTSARLLLKEYEQKTHVF